MILYGIYNIKSGEVLSTSGWKQITHTDDSTVIYYRSLEKLQRRIEKLQIEFPKASFEHCTHHTQSPENKTIAD